MSNMLPCPRVAAGKPCLSNQKRHQSGSAAWKKCAAAKQAKGSAPKGGRQAPALARNGEPQRKAPHPVTDPQIPTEYQNSNRSTVDFDDWVFMKERDESIRDQFNEHSVASPGLTYAVGPEDEVTREETPDGFKLTAPAKNGKDTVEFELKGWQQDTTGEMYARSYGGRNGELEGYVPTKEVAKKVRQELKKAQAVGYIPDNLEYSVTSSGILRVEVYGWDEDIYTTRGDNANLNVSREHQVSKAFREVSDRVKAISSQWGHNGSDAMIDYFDSSNIVYPQFRRERL